MRNTRVHRILHVFLTISSLEIETKSCLDMEERVQDGLEFMVLVIVVGFKLDKRKLTVGLVERFPILLAKLIISCLASLWTEGLGHPAVGYLGGSWPLHRFLCVSLGIPVQPGDVAEGIQGLSIGEMVYPQIEGL
ncbi:phenylalanine ammonia-lyase [Puccinia sorghi]|uniref:Phenylalanine ammonia-lyase n=1 Tax=Puccinia sorghi TaxID=27349 RepID=A0A0L6UNV3_9BASI|nr:phenylalanine ammonia-lyase [Puccinia sorghi]